MSWTRGGTPATHADVQAVVANLRSVTYDVRDDYGAAGDGSTNDTTACRAAMAAVASTGGVVFFPPGTYMVDTLYILGDNVHVRGAGKGLTTIKLRPGTTIDVRVLSFNFASQSVGPTGYQNRCSVADLTIDGNAPGVTAFTSSASSLGALSMVLGKSHHVRDVYILNPRELGLNIYSVTDMDIDDVTIDGMLGDSSVNQMSIIGDAYNADPGFTFNTYPTQGIRMRGCRLVNNNTNGGFGFCIQACSDITVSNSTVDLTGGGRTGYGIFVEGGGTSTASMLAKNITFTGNTVTGCAYGIGCMDTSGASVTTGIIDGYTITGNEADNCVTGIVVNGSNGTVTGNTVTADNPVSIGANKASVESNLVIVGNTLRAQASVGISANKQTASGSIEGLVISGNIIDGVGEGSTGAPGIIFYGAVHSFVIADNIIKNMPGAAVYLNSVSGTLQNQVGRVFSNQMLNNCRQAAGLTYPSTYSVVAAGVTDVLVALNYIVSGAGAVGHITNTTTPYLTVFANRTTGNTNVTDDTNHSLRLGGTVSGSKGANAALASLLSALAGLQLITDTTT